MRIVPPPSEDVDPEPVPCVRCDFDLHVCPGCGAPLQHGVEVCLRCRNNPLLPDPLRRAEHEEDHDA